MAELSAKMTRTVTQQGKIETQADLGLLYTKAIYNMESPKAIIASLYALKQLGYSDKQIMADPYLSKRFEAMQSLEQNRRIQDAESELGLHSGITKDQRQQMDTFYMYNPDLFHNALKTPGTFCTITGPPGKGKSNFAIYMAERAMQSGIPVISNIVIYNPPPIYFYITKLSEMIKTLCKLGTFCITILDEGGISAGRGDASTRRYKRIKKIAKTLRKFITSLVWIDQTYSSIPDVIQEFTRVKYHKGNEKTLDVLIETGNIYMNKTLKNVPQTGLNYESVEDFGYFDIDLDVNEAFAYANAEKDNIKISGTDQKERLIQYIDNKANIIKEGQDETTSEGIFELIETWIKTDNKEMLNNVLHKNKLFDKDKMRFYFKKGLTERDALGIAKTLNDTYSEFLYTHRTTIEKLESINNKEDGPENSKNQAQTKNEKSKKG